MTFAYLSVGTDRLYTFYGIDKIGEFSVSGNGSIEAKVLLAMLDQWASDAKSREETFSFSFRANPTTYNSATPGTGTYMDQLADILYIYRRQGQILNHAGKKYFLLQFAFPSVAKVSASHDVTQLAAYPLPDAADVYETGFVSDSSVYTIKGILKNVSTEEIDPMCQHCSIKVEFKRFGYVIAYG